MLEDYIRQQPALPELLASSSRASSKAKMDAQRAAIRHAAQNVRRREQPRGQTKAIIQQNREATAAAIGKSKSVAEVQHTRGSQIFASGPLGVAQDPGRDTSPGGASHRPRMSPEGDKSPAYLIRTDLRYSPSEDTVVALLELPGLRLEDVQLKLGSRSSGIRHLVVSAVSHAPPRVSGEVAMQERLYGMFTRTLIVPPHVSASDIQAEMKDGLLRLKIPGTKFEDVVIKHPKEESEV